MVGWFRSHPWIVSTLITFLCFGGVLWFQDRERADRRDQTCLWFEKDHLQDVIGLDRTYDYLVDLSPDERRDTINRFILRLLPENEIEALTDEAPNYCDEPGVALPEPDPVVRPRPQALITLYGDQLPPDPRQKPRKRPAK